jgi:NDP-sugar pyrophosphorylase family protein
MSDIEDAVILCGGAGIRLRPVTGTAPKSMVNVSGRPFLEMLLSQLERSGFRRVILAIGYQGAAIQSHFGETFCGMDVEYSNELVPLGTGGALRNAAEHVRATSCVVMNGDSYTDVDLEKFAFAHSESKADLSVVVVAVDGRSDCGSVVVDHEGNVVHFLEKERTFSARHVNAGIYGLSREILFEIPAGCQISLEREIVPRWIGQRKCVKAFIHSGKCVDIGTPDRYRAAQETLAQPLADVKPRTTKILLTSDRTI